jgi:8-oxo-dGTP diphosphatase
MPFHFDNLPSLAIERRWRGQLHPMPSILALIRRGEQMLLIKRLQPPYQGKWALVGGKWDFGEALDAVAVREVKEETGLDTEFVALRGIVNERVAPTDEITAGGHYLLFICEVVVRNGEAREQTEGPVAWFNSAEIAQLHAQDAIIGTDYVMIEKYDSAETSVPYVEATVLAQNGSGGETEIIAFTDC